MTTFRTKSMKAEMQKADGGKYEEYESYRFSRTSFMMKDKIGLERPIPSKRKKR